jgi:hypothetical protein
LRTVLDETGYSGDAQAVRPPKAPDGRTTWSS